MGVKRKRKHKRKHKHKQRQEQRQERKTLHNDLERCWLRQLAADHSQICLQYGVELRSPTFELSDSSTELGSWCPKRRRIKISRHLIFENPWFVTLQVLKHEMAHQLAWERLGSDQRPHGEAFGRACELLGVLPQFRTPHCPQSQMVESLWNGVPVAGNRHVARVKKLLALAESANEHEAACALDKARELIRQYQLETLTTGDDVELTCRIIDGKRKRLARYQHYICSLLSEFFLVQCVIAEEYHPECDDFFRVVELFGTHANVRVAEYCWFFLENHLELQWRRRKSTIVGHAGKYRNSFLLGMVQGFSAKLGAGAQTRQATDQRKRQEGQLQHLADRELDNYLACYHPRLQRRKTSTTQVYSESYREGMAAGKSLEFTQGIDHGENGFGGFLE